MITRVRVTVEGRVQGVGYRYSACARAKDLGLAGWVRNCPDGRVELEVEGDEDNVAALIDWCRRGPAFAAVSRVEIGNREWGEPRYTGFAIRS